MQRSKHFMIGITGVAVLFWGSLSLIAVMQGPDGMMQGADAEMQGVGMPSQGGLPQGVDLGNQSSGDSATTSANGSSENFAPSAFFVPKEGPLAVGYLAPGGAGKIEPYNPNMPATVNGSSSSSTANSSEGADESTGERPQNAQPSTLYAIQNPGILLNLLQQQPALSSSLNRSNALTIQDSAGNTYSVTTGQLQGFLQLLSDPDSGYQGSLDISALSSHERQYLLSSNALTPITPNNSQGQQGVPQNSSEGTDNEEGSDTSAQQVLEGGAPAGQTANQSGPPGGGREQQAQGMPVSSS